MMKCDNKISSMLDISDAIRQFANDRRNIKLHQSEEMMMKLRVFKEDDKKDETLHLRLIATHSECITLSVVYPDGGIVPGGNLLDITPRGVVLRPSVNESLGLPVNPDGYIKIT